MFLWIDYYYLLDLFLFIISCYILLVVIFVTKRLVEICSIELKEMRGEEGRWWRNWMNGSMSLKIRRVKNMPEQTHLEQIEVIKGVEDVHKILQEEEALTGNNDLLAQLHFSQHP